VASGWHGRGAVYGGYEVAASRGIGRGRAGELDGEVTGREGLVACCPVCVLSVAMALPRGGVGCAGTVSAGWGSARRISRAVAMDWGLMAVG
jgi:hypothetical protein